MSEQTQAKPDTSNVQAEVREHHPIPTPRQETLLIAVAFREEEGGIIVGQVTPDDFAEPYRVIAKPLWEYWAQHKQPPGRVHLDDIFGDLLTGKDAPQYRRMLLAFVHIEEHIHFNPQYAVELARAVQRDRMTCRCFFLVQTR
jgi:hypothetical protein